MSTSDNRPLPVVSSSASFSTASLLIKYPNHPGHVSVYSTSYGGTSMALRLQSQIDNPSADARDGNGPETLKSLRIFRSPSVLLFESVPSHSMPGCMFMVAVDPAAATVPKGPKGP